MGSLALIVTSIENEIPHFLLLVQQNFIGQFNYREYYLWKKDALYDKVFRNNNRNPIQSRWPMQTQRAYHFK